MPTFVTFFVNSYYEHSYITPFVRGESVAFFLPPIFFHQPHPRCPVFVQHLALHLGHDLLLGLALIVAPARLPHEEHAARLAEVLVAHLQHVEPRIFAVGLLNANDGKDEIGKVRPVGAARNGVHVYLLQLVPAVLLPQAAGMRHDDYPNAVDAPPCLHLRQHALDGLRLGAVAARFHLHEEVRVHDEILQREGAAHAVGHAQDVVGRGRHLVQVEVHHVAVEETDDGLQLFAGVGQGVHFAQHQLDEVGDVLVLVRHLEGKVADVTPGFCHQAAGEVVQEVGLAAVGLSGHNDQSALVGGMENVVGERAVTHFVAVVEVAVEDAQYLVGAIFHGDDVRGVLRAGGVDDPAHHIRTVGGEHVGDVLAISRQDGEEAAGAEVVGKVLDERPPGQVAVTADHEVARLEQPGFKGFEALAEVARRTVGHADDVRITRFVQRQDVFFALGDDDPADALVCHAQGVDAVDAVGRTGGGGRILAPKLGVVRRSGAACRSRGGGVARTVFDIDGAAVDVIYVGKAVAEGAGGVLRLAVLSVVAVLTVLSIPGFLAETAVGQAAQARVDGGFQGDVLVGKVAADGKLVGVFGLRIVGQGLDFGEDFRRKTFVVVGDHGHFGGGGILASHGGGTEAGGGNSPRRRSAGESA